MQPDLASLARTNGGFLLRRHLLRLGYNDAAIAAARRAGHLRRVRHGTYVPSEIWQLASDVERHAIVTRSVLERMGSVAVASHTSAAALHGLDLWGVDLSVVHVTRTDAKGGRAEAGVVIHENRLGSDDVSEVYGTPTTVPLRAAIEAAVLASVEAGMVTISSMIRMTGPSDAELEEMRRRSERWPGARSARLAISLSDGLLQSVGEVRSLYMMWRHGVPRPELQHRMRLDAGRSAFLDFWWELARHAGEFDGHHKYGRLNPFVGDPGRVLSLEKEREDAIRSQSAGMSRWVWADLAPAVQARTAATLLAAIDRSRRLYGRNATVLDLGGATSVGKRSQA